MKHLAKLVLLALCAFCASANAQWAQPIVLNLDRALRTTAPLDQNTTNIPTFIRGDDVEIDVSLFISGALIQTNRICEFTNLTFEIAQAQNFDSNSLLMSQTVTNTNFFTNLFTAGLTTNSYPTNYQVQFYWPGSLTALYLNGQISQYFWLRCFATSTNGVITTFGEGSIQVYDGPIFSLSPALQYGQSYMVLSNGNLSLTPAFQYFFASNSVALNAAVSAFNGLQAGTATLTNISANLTVDALGHFTNVTLVDSNTGGYAAISSNTISTLGTNGKSFTADQNGNITASGNLTLGGNVTGNLAVAGTLSGNGGGLTNLQPNFAAAGITNTNTGGLYLVENGTHATNTIEANPAGVFIFGSPGTAGNLSVGGVISGNGSGITNVAVTLSGVQSSLLVGNLSVYTNTDQNIYNVKAPAWGAQGNGTNLNYAQIATGSAVLTCTNAIWSALDVGKAVYIPYCGSTQGTNGLSTTIIGWNNSTNVVLGNSAARGNTNVFCVYGTDDTSAITNCINFVSTALTNTANGNPGAIIYFPRGIYVVNGALADPGAGTAHHNAQIYFPGFPTNVAMVPTIRLIGSGPNHISGQLVTNVAGTAGSTLWSTLADGQGGRFVDCQNFAQSVYGGFGCGAYVVSGNNFNLDIEGLNLRLPINPNMTGYDLEGAAQATVGHLMVDTGQCQGSVYWPVNTNSVGLSLPAQNNNASIECDDVTVIGCYDAFKGGEHIHIRTARAYNCQNGYYSQNGGAALSVFDFFEVQWCGSVFNIGSVCPVQLFATVYVENSLVYSSGVACYALIADTNSQLSISGRYYNSGGTKLPIIGGGNYDAFVEGSRAGGTSNQWQTGINFNGGLSSLSTNILTVSSTAYSQAFSTLASGWTNTTGQNAEYRATASSCTAVLYTPAGAGGISPVLTNTSLSSIDFPLPSGAGIQILSGSGVVPVVLFKP